MEFASITFKLEETDIFFRQKIYDMDPCKIIQNWSWKQFRGKTTLWSLIES